MLFCSGNLKGIDEKKLPVDHEALFDWLCSVMERDDMIFEEVYWIRIQVRITFVNLTSFLRKLRRPNIRMANTFGQGRVFITGGESVICCMHESVSEQVRYV